MMKKVLFLFLFLLLAFSCSKHTPSQSLLLRAEQLMKDQPDSALGLLRDSVRTAGLSRRQYAEWCLLLTQAWDKKGGTHTSDSLIRVAVDYFEAYGPPARQMLAYYSWGRVSQGLQRAPAATDYYLKALEIGENSDDYALLGRIHSNLGMLYTYQNAFDLALLQMQQALHCLGQLGDTASQSFVLRDMGRTYRQIDSLELSLHCYEQALEYADTNSRPSILNELSGLPVEMKAYDKAEALIQEYLQLVKTPGEHIGLILGRLFADTGKGDSARYYLQKSTGSSQLTTRAAAYYYLYKLAAKESKWEEYARSHEIYDVLRDSISAQTFTETMLKMQYSYDYQRIEAVAKDAKINQVRAERNSLLIALLALCIVGYVVCHFLYLRAKKKKQRRALSNSFQEFGDKLNTNDIGQLEDNILQIEALSNDIKKMEKDGEFILFEISLLNQIKQFVEKKIREEEQEQEQEDEKAYHLKSNQLYDLFQRGRIQDITDDKKKELEAFINEAYPTFNATIRKCDPSVNSEDLFLCYLIKMGLKRTRISKIFHITLQAASMKCSRLAKRFLGGDKKSPSDLDDFISSL
ncbi:MAG: tetratricopeptide repeat protein [Clostridiales bacterium]|nr:tetratricopeptide repeat protein [Clostridiales bacterium]